MERVIEVEVTNPYSDIELKKDMTIGDRMIVDKDRLKVLEEVGKKNKVELVKVVKIIKKEG